MSWAPAAGAPFAPAVQRRRTRRVLGAVALALALLLVLLLAVLGYVGWRAQQAVDHLRSAADRVPALTGQLSSLDAEGAAATAQAMQEQTAAAVAITDDPVWRAVEHFPWGGQNLRAAEAGARAADRLATQGAGGAVDSVAAVVDLRDRALSLDLDPTALREDAAAAQDGAAALLEATGAARRELDGIDRRYLLPPAASALEQAEAATATLEGLEQGLRDPLGALGNAL